LGEGQKRNQLCACGSGKKYKYCCIEKKPRNTALSINCSEPTAVNSLRIGPNGEVKFLTDGKLVIPKTANLTTSYERENKPPKILFDIPVPVASLGTNEVNNLKRYDYIFAVDTNYHKFNTYVIAVAAIVLCKIDLSEILYAPVKYLLLKTSREKPENIIWAETIRLIKENPEYSNDFSYAIVVDSDYGNLQKYNSRQLSIIEDFYLPLNFTLIYASADSGSENIVNSLIKLCDKEATYILKDVMDSNIIDTLNEDLLMMRNP